MDPYIHSVSGHQPTVVASVVLAVLTAYVALELAGRVHRAPDRLSGYLWVVAGSVTMGSGIWSTHFVGMSAAEYPFEAGYDLGLTFTSWIVAVLASAVVMAASSRDAMRWRVAIPYAIFAGCGAAAMHYLGAEALIVHPTAVYHPLWVVASVTSTIVGTLFALVLFFRHRDSDGRSRVFGQLNAAGAYAAGLVGLHYCGMAASSFEANSVCLSRDGLEVDMLGGAIGFAALTFLSLVLLMSVLERRAEARAARLRASLDNTREELRVVTFNDAVTGLPNRLVFQDRLKQAVARCDRVGDSLAVVFVDLDGFKAVDHSWNNSTGDATLRHVAARLTEAARASDTVATIGGDHFLILMDGLSGTQPAVQLAERLVTMLRGGRAEESEALHVTASIGISVYPQDGPMSALVGRASTAAGAVRDVGGNGYRFFETRMNAEAHARSEWLDDLRHACDLQQLELHYQPKVHARSGKIAGVEALLRWRHPTRGLVSPVVFIPLAEQFGLIDELGDWVIDEACRQIRAWGDDGIRMRVAINLSVHQLRQPGLPERITAALARHCVEPALLSCEITESNAMDTSNAIFTVLERIRAAGIQLSIDDFGTGYSNLSYLRKLPVRQLKIDRSFVSDIAESEDARLVVAGIINLAHALRLEVVAEGVETNEQMQVLLELDCDKFQGFLFGRPVPASALTCRAEDRKARVDEFLTSIFATPA